MERNMPCMRAGGRPCMQRGNKGFVGGCSALLAFHCLYSESSPCSDRGSVARRAPAKTRSVTDGRLLLCITGLDWQSLYRDKHGTDKSNQRPWRAAQRTSFGEQMVSNWRTRSVHDSCLRLNYCTIVYNTSFNWVYWYIRCCIVLPLISVCINC